ncbi:MAG: DUF4328 domain-containing protein [Acidimicrobiales bacterium]|nr:DUF4328 domain-containing protein [Acidimicrobiales bacterium]MCB0970116.1 DUF4328 domain-containing protein [Acidimicrobiales bacterium]
MSGGDEQQGGGAQAPPGWYPTPDGRTAWWDGTQWHLDAQPPTAAAPVPGVPSVPGTGQPGYGQPGYGQPGYGPPGYGAYGAYQPAMGPRAPYTNIKSLAGIVQALAVIVVACHGAAILVDIWRLSLLSDDASLTFDRLDTLDGADALAAIVGLVLGLAFLVNGVLFLVWRHRVQRNLGEALGVAYLEYTPGWSVGWWFVPFANLVKPKQAMNEAWTASSASEPPGTAGWRQRKAPPLLSWWWGFLMAGYLAGAFIGVAFGDASSGVYPSVSQLRANMMGSIVSSGFYIAAGVAFLKIVRGITDRVAERARVLGMGTE